MVFVRISIFLKTKKSVTFTTVVSYYTLDKHSVFKSFLNRLNKYLNHVKAEIGYKSQKSVIKHRNRLQTLETSHNYKSYINIIVT